LFQIRADIQREKTDLEKSRHDWDDLNARFESQRKQLKFEYEAKWAKEKQKWDQKNGELEGMLNGKTQQLRLEQAALDEERLRLLHKERELKSKETELQGLREDLAPSLSVI